MDNLRTPAWLPLTEAAQQLGVSVDAIRKRIRRGLVESRKGNDGRIMVLATDEPPAGQESSDMDELAHLQSEVERWRALAEERAIKLATAEARGEGREMLISELRTLLAEARLPWWRRLLG